MATAAAFDAAAYAASKAAAVAMIDSLAADLKGTGIRVNSVLPSIIDTDANRKAMPKADFTKWPKPEEIARVILFLCSEEARLIHGAAVARYTEKRIEKLTRDPAIIRNRLKVEAAVRNAREFLAVQQEFGTFDAYCWRFVDGRPKVNRWKAMRQIPATSAESDTLSKDLKRRGFSFVGSTVIYAHMQAIGMVNDHLVDCFRYREVQTPRRHYEPKL